MSDQKTINSKAGRAASLRVWIANLSSQKDEHDRKSAGLQEHISLLEEMEQEIRSGLCHTCKGMGKLREWINQGESKLVTCSTCKGQGSTVIRLNFEDEIECDPKTMRKFITTRINLLTSYAHEEIDDFFKEIWCGYPEVQVGSMLEKLIGKKKP